MEGSHDARFPSEDGSALRRAPGVGEKEEFHLFRQTRYFINACQHVSSPVTAESRDPINNRSALSNPFSKHKQMSLKDIDDTVEEVTVGYV